MTRAPDEQRLREIAEVVLVDPRLIRHVVKHHRRVSGAIPHTRCYALPMLELLDIVPVSALRLRQATAREWVILAAKASPGERQRGRRRAKRRLDRATFHARVHILLESRVRAGVLTKADVRRRIEQIGRVEFEEIRSVLAHDDQLVSTDDVDVYVEFAALYLELREFAPELLVVTFPGLYELERIDELLAREIDVEALLELSDDAPMSSSVLRSARSLMPPAKVARPRLNEFWQNQWLNGARRAARDKRYASAMLRAARALQGPSASFTEAAKGLLRVSAEALSERLLEAIDVDPTPGQREPWRDMMVLLARESAESPLYKRPPEAQVLLALDRVAQRFETPGVIVDVPSWIFSGGRTPIVRSRSNLCSLDTARTLMPPLEAVRASTLPAAERARMTELMEYAVSRAEDNLRSQLRPKLRLAFRYAGMRAEFQVERLAREKLVEELLDEIVARGFISLPALRDAISRNDLKLSDLSGAGVLLRGDALLLADAALARELDGIYRRGDAYLRFLQKLSSLPFGTRSGRAVMLFFLVPAVGAFVVLEGLQHLLNPALSALGSVPFQLLTPLRFAGVALLLLGLIHSLRFRRFAREALNLVGVVLAWAFFRVPRAILRLPRVERWLSRPGVRMVLRCLLLPALIALLVYALSPTLGRFPALRWAATLGTFIVVSGLLASRVGIWVEDYLTERVAPTWRVLSREWLPSLFHVIGRAFRALMDAVERVIYAVDDALRFRSSPAPPWVVLSGVVGTFWAMAAYLIRLYVTLLVEPELNPLKHFPVVTVAHKLMLPFLPQLLALLEGPFLILGSILGGALAALTVFLLPSMFGFLVWEFKENYRLYRATRANVLEPVRFGPHGETLRGLLVLGLHAGTLPKHYERLRRAAQHYEGRRTSGVRSGLSFAQDPEMVRFRQGLHHVQRAVRRFVERELLPPLRESRRWKLRGLSVLRVDLSSNRVRVQLALANQEGGACELTLEQLGGFLVASISRPGFISGLDADHALLFENALAGFYHRAGISVVREQVSKELGEGAHFEISDEGLVVWPGDNHETELVYDLDTYRRRLLKPRVRGLGLEDGAPPLESWRVLYEQQTLSWSDWCAAWEAADQNDASIPRLVGGSGLLTIASR